MKLLICFAALVAVAVAERCNTTADCTGSSGTRCGAGVTERCYHHLGTPHPQCICTAHHVGGHGCETEKDCSHLSCTHTQLFHGTGGHFLSIQHCDTAHGKCGCFHFQPITVG